MAITKEGKKWRVKIPVRASSGIRSPLETGTRGYFFPEMGDDAKTGDGDLGGDRDGEYVPQPQPAPLPSLG